MYILDTSLGLSTPPTFPDLLSYTYCMNTRASIEKEEHKQDGPGTKDTTVFNACFFYALSNGISKITMNAESLQIVKRGELYTMPWAAITDACLTSKIIRGGKYISNYTYNTINLSTAKQSFTFHSSPYLPNHFKNNMEGRLIPELKKYVTVSTTKNSKPHFRMNVQSCVVLLFILVVLTLLFVLPSGN